ncbi:cupin domain-containing protein [Nocardia sp. NPDC056541]|uniref:cupin domain-containing protein n=1 Tax=Nocardia sp. NPDC056541 TaxID=3345860 RepID=UPI00366F852A
MSDATDTEPMLVTTLDAWRSGGDQLPVDDDRTAWAADDESALLVADALAPTAQILVVTPRAASPTAGHLPAGKVRWARRGPAGRHTELLHRPSTAETLDLLPHPEGGWFRETWRSAHTFAPTDYPGPRAAATGILFLLPEHEQSIWHAVRSDELWMWHRGGPLELLLGGDSDTPTTTETVILGPAIESGQRVQQLVPAGNWQAARPCGGAEVLVSCVVAPGFDFEDFRS